MTLHAHPSTPASAPSARRAPAPLPARALRHIRLDTTDEPPRTGPACSQCGSRTPYLHAELKVEFLVQSAAGPVIAQFCNTCKPTAVPVLEIACHHCQDGPLLVGDLANPDHPAAKAWLQRRGWHCTPDGWICSEHSARTVTPSGGAVNRARDDLRWET